MKKKYTTGFVIGKFMPLHQGHELLIDFAKHHVDKLFVVIDNVPPERHKSDCLSGKVRTRWMHQAFPQANVLYLPNVNPQEPSEHPDFWNIWKKSLLDILPEKPDYVFAAESYGLPLAKTLGSIFIPVELEREAIPISGKKIRENLYENWHYLSRVAKPDFTLRICVGGPESAGKTTLVKELAKYFKTIFVPEYARSFIKAQLRLNKNYKIELKDMITIARGQAALEDSLIHKANRVLICDTDVWATTLWSKWLFQGRCAKEIPELAKQKTYDLYLLAKPDIKWEKDEARYFKEPEKRLRFFREYEAILKSNGVNYKIIEGGGERRTKMAIEIVEKFIKEKFNFQYFVKKLNL